MSVSSSSLDDLRVAHSLRDQEDEEGVIEPFEWDSCPPDQMLVFAIDELDSIFDVIITKMKPVRTKSQRTIPANVIFLCARFAQYFGSTEMLEELFLGAIERIEMAVHVRCFSYRDERRLTSLRR